MIEVIVLLALTGMMHAARSFSPEMASGATELAFGYLLLAAYFSGRLGSRLGLPKLTGYLLTGVIAGPFVLELVTHEMAASLRVVSGVATCILGLTAGGELDLKRVKPLFRTLRAISVFAVMSAMIVLTGLLFILRPFFPMFAGMPTAITPQTAKLIAVALSAQSPAVVMALLSETKAEGPLSRLILSAVVLADLGVIIVYSFVAAIATTLLGGEINIGETGLEIAWEVFGSIGFGVAIGGLIGAFLRFVKGASASLFALLICVIVAEIGGRIALDPLVVMLSAGVWLKNFSRSDAGSLLHGFESAELPVFLVFFSLSGAKLDIHQLWATAIPVAIIAAARAGVFFLGCRFACARTRADPVVSRYAWTGLVPQAGLSLALVVVIQKNFPTFGDSAAVLLLSVVGVNQLIAPLLLRMSLIRSGEAGKRIDQDFAAEH
jgi:Kef-type K+ transport system membrane component KefB